MVPQSQYVSFSMELTAIPKDEVVPASDCGDISDIRYNFLQVSQYSRVPNIEKVLSLRSLINRNNMQIICIPKIRNIILVLKFICRTHIMWSHLIKIDILWGDPNQPFTHDVIICTFFIFIRIDYL